MAPPEEKWGFVIELAYDTHNPPTEEEQKQLQEAFEFISEGIKRIMGGGETKDNLANYIVHGDFH